MMPVFGLIGAGNYDLAVLETLLRRLRPDLEKVVVRRCGNDYRVTTTLTARLQELSKLRAVGRLDKAIVVKDSHRAAPGRELEKLREAIEGRDYPFPVEFAVAVRALESWLLVDDGALSTVAGERGAQRQFPAPDRSPEQFPNPKGRLSELLAEAQIPYTEAVAIRIAELVSLERIEALCPSFTLFKRAAEHC
jgi:hypothetical protein